MAEYEKEVRKILRQNGYLFLRHGKGDHDIWINSDTNMHVTVDGKIKSRHTANAIMKQSQINYHF
ncbi:addiction module toxin, HicA family protein [Clostridia bacterium]|nr:addiction module toxin, HicA family protein [Clostridia bacterium]